MSAVEEDVIFWTSLFSVAGIQQQVLFKFLILGRVMNRVGSGSSFQCLGGQRG